MEVPCFEQLTTPPVCADGKALGVEVIVFGRAVIEVVDETIEVTRRRFEGDGDQRRFLVLAVGCAVSGSVGQWCLGYRPMSSALT